MKYQSGPHAEGTRQYIASIKPYLHSPRAVLDIGCNEGMILADLVGESARGYGYEANPKYFDRARDHHADREQLEFVNRIVRTEDIPGLPDADVILFLSVHHQIVKNQSLKYANRFLVDLFEKTGDKLFFSPAMIYAKYGRDMPFSENNHHAAVEYFLTVVQSAVKQPVYARSIGLAVNDIPKSEPFRPIILFSKTPIGLELQPDTPKKGRRLSRSRNLAS